jgi:hypothetical protein
MGLFHRFSQVGIAPLINPPVTCPVVTVASFKGGVSNSPGSPAIERPSLTCDRLRERFSPTPQCLRLAPEPSRARTMTSRPTDGEDKHPHFRGKGQPSLAPAGNCPSSATHPSRAPAPQRPAKEMFLSMPCFYRVAAVGSRLRRFAPLERAFARP